MTMKRIDCATCNQREKMQTSILHFRHGNSHLVVDRLYRPRLRRCGIHLGVNEIRCQRQDDRQAGDGRSHHPVSLSAILRFVQPAFRVIHWRGWWLRVRRVLPLPKNHHHHGAKNKDKKEQFVPDDWPQNGHLRLARWNPTRLTQFVQPSYRQLNRHQYQDRTGHRKKAMQRHLQRALEEK